MYTSTDVGKRLGVHANTIRTWSDRYKTHLTPGAVSGNRLYTDADLRVLATIAHYRQLGISLDEVAGILADGKLIDELPVEPSPNDEAARAAVQLIPRDQLFRALDEVKRLEDERARLMIERDSAIVDKQTLNDKIASLTGEIGELRGKLAIIEQERRPVGFWLRWLAVAVIVAVIVMIVLFIVIVQTSQTR